MRNIDKHVQSKKLPRLDPVVVLGMMFLTIGWGAIELFCGLFSLFGITIG